MIEKIEEKNIQKGGKYINNNILYENINIFNKKNENFNINNIVDINNNMVKNKKFTINKLCKLIKNMIKDDLSYLIYKQHISDVKKILGDNFDEINRIIVQLSHIGKFLGKEKSDDYHKYVRRVYKHMSELYKIINNNDYFNEYDKLYINSIKKIYDELPEEKYKEGQFALQDFIICFEYYENLNLNDNINNFYNNIYNSYDIRDIDLDYIDEPLMSKDEKKDRKMMNDCKNKKILLTKKEKHELMDKISEWKIIDEKTREKLWEELEKKREERYRLRKQQEIQKGGQLKRIKNFFGKYIKYKCKYIDLKKYVYPNTNQ